MAGPAAGAAGRAPPARARGDPRACTDGVGPEGHADADGLREEEPVGRSAGEPRRGATSTRPPPVDRPTARPRGAAGPSPLLSRAREWGTSARCGQERGPHGPRVRSGGERGGEGRSRGRVETWPPACRGSPPSAGPYGVMTSGKDKEPGPESGGEGWATVGVRACLKKPFEPQKKGCGMLVKPIVLVTYKPNNDVGILQTGVFCSTPLMRRTAGGGDMQKPPTWFS
jgi:hypothetical protein